MMMMETVKDEWLRAAMADDTVVVELLLRLRHLSHGSSSSSAGKSLLPATYLRWGIRQPRSRSSFSTSSSSPIIRCDGAVSVKKEKTSGDSTTTTRCSPTTPLSWSGGGGSSSPLAGTADGGFEESSRPSSSRSPPAASRSKGMTVTNEITSNTSNKRPRRKKTFAELKEEESSLLKERVQLKEKIATLRETFKEQNVRNENLKRMKLDLALHPGKNLSLISERKVTLTQPRQREVSLYNHRSSTLPVHTACDDDRKPDSYDKHDAASSRDSCFLLPDLNMMPAEDDSRTDTLYGTS